MRRLTLSIILLLLFACTSASDELHKLKLNENVLLVEIADDDQERATGLMWRDFMPENQGMIFVYAEPKRLSFWMKNTKIPLDIAFIDAAGTIKQIETMKPQDTSHTLSKNRVKYALEVNKGWFANHNVKVGDKVDGLP